MLTAESTRRQELERQVELCVKIAGLGFGPEVTRLAMERQGVPPHAAQLIALSVATSRAALKRIEDGSLRPAPARTMPRRDVQYLGAIERLIGNLVAFFFFGLVAIGGGLILGWAVGFEYGTASGLDSVERAL
ncbi:MAG TPA: hypothetical protein VJQ51_12680, partial [Burkholderiales bacterium]|nr:hypothetical protein [Burkholderiales bacterium]